MNETRMSLKVDAAHQLRLLKYIEKYVNLAEITREYFSLPRVRIALTNAGIPFPAMKELDLLAQCNAAHLRGLVDAIAELEELVKNGHFPLESGNER